MAYYQAQGTSPVAFVDANQSQQELPLSEVYFTLSGLDASTAALYTANSSASPTNKAILDVLLPRLAAQGYLAASASALTLTISAVQAGALTYTITVKFEKSTVTGAVDMTVSASNTYAGIAPGGLTAALSAGESLASVTGAEDSGMPENLSLQAIGASLAVMTAADNTKTAFTLEPTLSGMDASLVEAAVSQDSSGTTYSVVVSWTKKATGITMASLLTNNPFAYLVSISGVAGPPPAPTTITLTGGTAASGSAAATSASANLYE